MIKSALLKTAMLGTHRSADLGDAPDPVLQTSWQALSSNPDPARALLQAAAIEHTYCLAGVSALRATQPTACEAETKPYVSPAAASMFIDLTQREFKTLTTEWILVARSRGLIATPRLLPSLLAIGASNSSLREAISELVGKRGLWLANCEGKWPWLNAASQTQANDKVSDEKWKTGTPIERRQWLQVQLQLDPELAAESIASSWPGDAPDTREMFAALVATNPHAAHEAWLQKFALCDRRQAIRGYAVAALMAIDNSGFRKRSLARAADLISVSKKLLKKSKIDCQPPAAFQEDWKTDGIREKPPSGTGPRDFWLQQILSVIPLDDWSVMTGHDNPIALEIESDWSDTVIKSWQQSALTHAHSPAVVPLLQRLSTMNGKAGDASNVSAISAIVAQLDFDRVADVLEQLSLSDTHTLELMIQTMPVLSADHHPKIHNVATEWVFKKNQLSRAHAIALAGCCDRKVIPVLLDKISKAAELTSAAEEFTRTLEYRQSYLKHFDNERSAGIM